MRTAEGGPLARALRAAGSFLLRVPLPLALLIVLLWGLVIWDLSSTRVPLPRGSSLGWEFLSNLAHAPLFGLLALWLAAVVLRERDGGWPRPSRARDALVLGLVLAYGVLDELHQSRVPGRDASALDVLTDVVGALLVLWIVRSLGRVPERTLLTRLGLGLLACCASAALALLS
ncbi:MAG TPA: VanZ family protein [Planctomycetota bacterium]